jgi:hypothetical protein
MLIIRFGKNRWIIEVNSANRKLSSLYGELFEEMPRY